MCETKGEREMKAFHVSSVLKERVLTSALFETNLIVSAV